MAGQSFAPRRPVLSALLSGAALWLLSGCVPAFVGTGASASQRGSRVAARVSAGYLERHGPRDADVPFNSLGATHNAQFQNRPFGILRYQPGAGGKGAMAMEIQSGSEAHSAGVQGGWVVKSINGRDVLGEHFTKIMDMLDDEAAAPGTGLRLARAADTPLAVTFTEVPGYVYKGAAPAGGAPASSPVSSSAGGPSGTMDSQEGSPTPDIPVWVF